MSAIDCSVRLIAAACLLALPLAAATVDFQREVRPILSDNCFQCHGPDKDTRMVDLRLDTKEGAFRDSARTARAIVPGKPQGEPAVSAHHARKRRAAHAARRLAQDADAASRLKSLRAGSSRARTWKEHWAFAAPVRPALPAVRYQAWVRNPIDQFILARLEAAGLQPAPGSRPPHADSPRVARPDRTAADARRGRGFRQRQLARRLRKAGRPAARVAALWRAPRPLLARCRPLCRHARHPHRQLSRDVAVSRLGDSAFNRNLPFDRFTIEQLAGDLLPNRTLDQQIASGFQRCNVTTNEGGSIPDEVAAMYAKDRADTTGTVWLGLTVGCATCHDHKFDPIAQKEFYSLTAFFRNTTQYPMDGNSRIRRRRSWCRARDQERWGIELHSARSCSGLVG